ncbi:MAG: hypothetical protein IT424_00875 [Pirellulales bacterium]|nr:hypothetical protein [Pirellulales bacterium]
MRDAGVPVHHRGRTLCTNIGRTDRLRAVAGIAALAATGFAALPVGAYGSESQSGRQFVSCLHPQIVRAPYVWKQTGPPTNERIEAAMPGAYLRGAFSATSRIALVVAGEANIGCPEASMPIIEFSIDDEPYQVAALRQHAGDYSLALADQLDPARPHRVEVIFRAADLTNGRWTKTSSRLRVAGFALDDGGQIEPTPRRRKLAIGFGDSITEGVGVDGAFASWQALEPNNARATWLPLLAAALDAEYGQLGSGGQGMVRGLELPPLTATWDRFDSETSRLTEGKLIPQPDYVFCAMGTNDFEKEITDAYVQWLAAVRAACPTSRIFCIVPPLQVHAGEIAKAASARNAAGDARVHLIETAMLASEYGVGRPTCAAYDGVHPNVYGQGRLAAVIAAKAGAALDRE